MSRLWLGAVLRAIAKVPPGEKLRIADMARSLGIAAEFGRLDGKTLRPPAARPTANLPAAGERKRPPAAGPEPASIPVDGPIPANRGPVPTVVPPSIELRPTGAQLYRRLKEEGARRGMTATAVGRAVFACSSQMTAMKHGRRAVHAATLAKAEAWLASKPVATTPDDDGELLAEVEAFLRRSGMSASAFGMAANRDGNLVKCMRQGRAPRARSADRIRAFIASWQPPAAPASAPAVKKIAPGVRKLRPYCAQPENCVAPSRGGCPKCQPMSRVRERSGNEQAAAIRRGITKQAERLLEGDRSVLTTGGRINQAVRGAMNAILEKREREARAADPVEIAKTALRSRGRVVFDASVHGGEKGRYIVVGIRDEASGKNIQHTAKQLIAIAERVNPRAMRIHIGRTSE